MPTATKQTALRRSKHGKFFVPPALLKRRFQVASHMLLSGATLREIAKALGIGVRQCHRLLKREDFNEFYEQYSKVILGTLTKVVQGRLREMIPAGLRGLYELITQRDNLQVRLGAIKELFMRCRVQGIDLGEAPTKSHLSPGQEKAIENAARLLMDSYENADPEEAIRAAVVIQRDGGRNEPTGSSPNPGTEPVQGSGDRKASPAQATGGPRSAGDNGPRHPLPSEPTGP